MKNIIHSKNYRINEQIIIRKAKADEWDEAMALAWKVFRKYDALDYSAVGCDSFLNFISDERLHKMFLLGEYKLFIAKVNNSIAGIISLRTKNHISLLFVDGKYHKRGIGRKLIDYAIKYIVEEERLKCCTVNAAPYAVEFYHKLGFIDLSKMEENQGIISVLMKKEFN